LTLQEGKTSCNTLGALQGAGKGEKGGMNKVIPEESLLGEKISEKKTTRGKESFQNKGKRRMGFSLFLKSVGGKKGGCPRELAMKGFGTGVHGQKEKSVTTEGLAVRGSSKTIHKTKLWERW